MTPETIKEKEAAISKFLAEKGAKEGKMQVLRFGKGTILLEGHDDIIYATSFYGVVSKNEMKLAHKAIKGVREKIGNALLETKPLPQDFADTVCRAFGVVDTPPQAETVEDRTVSSILEKVEERRTPSGATESMVFKALSSMPRGIPTDLSGRSFEQLVEVIMLAPYARSDKGDFIMEIDGKWYQANPRKLNRFLQPYQGSATTLEQPTGPRLPGIKGEVQAEIDRVRPTGYNVGPLEKALRIDEEEARNLLLKYRRVQGKADELMAQLDGIDPAGFEEEWERMVEDILNLKKLKEVAKGIKVLQCRAKDRDRNNQMKLQRLRKEVEELQAQGFTVPHLFRLLQSGNVKHVEEALLQFEAEKERLKTLEDWAHRLKDKGFDVEVEAIRHHLGDPDKIPYIEQELQRLEDDLRMEEERERFFAELEGRMEAWERQGFDTQKLHAALTEDFEVLRQKVEVFDRRVKEMINLEVSLHTLKGKGLDGEIEQLRILISDVDNVEAVKAALEDIRSRITDHQRAMRGFLDRIKELESRGQPGFEDRIRGIRIMASSPSKAGEVEAALKDLEKEMSIARGEFVPRSPKRVARSDLSDIIKNLPKRLPSTLWGRTPEKLASEVMKGPFGNTPDRKVVVRISRRWYYYEPDDPGILLQEFKGEVKLVEAEEEGMGLEHEATGVHMASKEALQRKARGRKDFKEVTAEDISQLTPIEYPFELTEIEILEKVSTLPRGLPSSLWRSDLEELAKDIVEARYARTPTGQVVVCIDGEWYHGDPRKPGNYLQVYRG